MENECASLRQSHRAMAAAVSLFGPKQVTEAVRQTQLKNFNKAWWACRCRLDGEEEEEPTASFWECFQVNMETGEEIDPAPHYRSRCAACFNILTGKRDVNRSCDLRCCPFCWVKQVSIRVCDLLIEHAQRPEASQRSLVLLQSGWQMPRFGEPEVELKRALEFLKPQVSPKSLVWLDELLGRRICGRVSLFYVEPVSERWILKAHHLLLVPRLDSLPKRGKVVGQGWTLHEDWSYNGLARLAGLATRFPNGWLRATAFEWRGIQRVWRGVRILRTVGDFRS